MELTDYALNERHKVIVRLRGKGASWDRIADEVGLNERSVRRAYRAIQRRAAQHGLSPDHDMTHTVPFGYKVKGVSTLYNEDGQLSGLSLRQTTRPEPKRYLRQLKTPVQHFPDLSQSKRQRQ